MKSDRIVYEDGKPIGVQLSTDDIIFDGDTEEEKNKNRVFFEQCMKLDAIESIIKSKIEIYSKAKVLKSDGIHATYVNVAPEIVEVLQDLLEEVHNL